MDNKLDHNSPERGNEEVYISRGLSDGKIYFIDKIISESLLDFLKQIVNPDYWNMD